MATRTQAMNPTDGPLVRNASRYHSRKEGASHSEPFPLEPATSGLHATRNQSILRSMSRYRKAPSKQGPASTPPLPRLPSSPKGARQVHAESLAALTGEPSPHREEMMGSPMRKRTGTDLRQDPNSRMAASRRKNAPVQSPIAIGSSFAPEESSHPRPLSWESDGAARGRVELSERHLQQQNTMGLKGGIERNQQPQAQRAAYREAKRRSRRDAAARDSITAKQSENYKPRYEHREQANDQRQMWETQQLAAEERAHLAENGSGDLISGSTVQGRLGSFARKKSADLRGPGKVRIPPEANYVPQSRNTEGVMGGSTSNPPAPVGIPSHFGSADWLDAPVRKPPSEEPVVSGPAQWVDAPVSRPKIAEKRPVVIPQYDAPVSAVNAGQRHVLVQCKSSTITLPVTPTTTSSDIVNSAAEAMPESVEPRTSKLVESFTQLGLERPLRNYEHIRDVMNSWDNDAQNIFIIMDVTPDQRRELDSKHVSAQQPGETSVCMYHSQKPRTWDKRWITLRSDGQVTIAKRRGHETSNICHLTDFDIYVPTPRQQSKRIKPPRKICFAVKSFQKSNMFLDGANFVHFFASSDKIVAAEWYKAVHGWRSWYLTNVLGEGPIPKQHSTTGGPGHVKRFGSQRRAPSDVSPYQPRSSDRALDSTGESRTRNNSISSRAARFGDPSHAAKLSSRDRAPPPSAFLNKLNKESDSIVAGTNHVRQPGVVKGLSPDELEAADSTPLGLLGRTYSQRQKSQWEYGSRRGGEEALRPNDPLPPPSSAGGGLKRRASTKSSREPTPAVGLPVKPLIDLTPQYQEPPQHVKKGKGVAAVPGQRLVDAATGLELDPCAIVTPSARAWRRPEAPPLLPPPQPSLTSPRTPTRPTTPTTPNYTHAHAYNRPYDQSEHLSRTASVRTTSSPGHRRQQVGGRGVRTGDRNAVEQPLVDLQIKSQFADGSLLRRVEQQR